MRISPHRHPLSLALIVAVTATALPSHASETTPAVAELDRVSVTGSRITRAGFVTPSPVTSISAEEIRASGATNIGELITRLPSLRPTYTLGNSTRSIGTAGIGLLDLRGMGTARTLVLVNGRRHVGAVSGSASVDVNTLPVEWVERIEIITGGASAIYGADAVAGVVNYILKRNYEGIEARAQTGMASEGSFGKSFASAAAGTNFAGERGNIALAVEYSKQDRMVRSQRAIGRAFLVSVPNPDYDPSQPPSQRNPQTVISAPGGNHSISTGGTFHLGKFDFRDPASWGNRYQFNPDGGFRPQRYDGVVVSNTRCVDCDFVDLNAVADLQPQFTRKSVNVLLDFDLSPAHRLYLEGKYSQSTSDFLSQPAFDTNLRIRRDNPYLDPALATLMADKGMPQLSLSRFNVDAGQRGEHVVRTTQRFVLGVEGSLDGQWSYDISGNWGQSEVKRWNLNNRINERWQAGLDTAIDPRTGLIVCRTTLDPEATNPNNRGQIYSAFAREGCVPFNVFGDGAVSQQAQEWFNVDSFNFSRLQQTVFSASLANGALLMLPAGDVGIAAGLEYRREKSREITDPLSARGLTFLNAIPDSKGRYDVREAFLETSIPLLAELPGITQLTLDAAGRWSDYSSIGRTRTWKAGLDWTVTPSLRLRGTLSQAVRAPGIGELYKLQSENFAGISDPCNYLATNPNRPDTAKDIALRQANCSALGIPVGWIDTYSASRPGVSGGNPELKQERARSLTYGLVWQPDFLPGFGLSIDYWRINLVDAIGRVGGQTNATRCVDAPGGIDNAFCSAIERAPIGGMTDDGGRTYPEHAITFWRGLDENLARSRRIGIDLEMDYRFPLVGGDSSIRLIGTRLLQSREWQFQESPADYVEYVTHVSNPRWRANLGGKYARGDWYASWDMNYIDGNLRVPPGSYNSNPGQSRPIRNGAYTYHDLKLGYTFPGGRIGTYLGIDNAFDKDPPLNYFGESAGTALYDNVGRYLYLGITYKL